VVWEKCRPHGGLPTGFRCQVDWAPLSVCTRSVAAQLYPCRNRQCHSVRAAASTNAVLAPRMRCRLRHWSCPNNRRRSCRGSQFPPPSARHIREDLTRLRKIGGEKGRNGWGGFHGHAVGSACGIASRPRPAGQATPVPESYAERESWRLGGRRQLMSVALMGNRPTLWAVLGNCRTEPLVA
jgi:hypothetical protein